jgi:sugar lactone lactonase YvrE
VGVVSSSMTTRVLATGIAMGESPRWHDGRLWVCDWLAGEVLTIPARSRAPASPP